LNSITLAGVVSRVTEARSCAAVRPQLKAALLNGIDTPFSSIAFMIEASCSGTCPFWKA